MFQKKKNKKEEKKRVDEQSQVYEKFRRMQMWKLSENSHVSISMWRVVMNTSMCVRVCVAKWHR